MKSIRSISKIAFIVMILAGILSSCVPQGGTTTKSSAGSGGAGNYIVAPGEHDEFYNFVSGGFNGQMSVYGLPSGRMLRIIPVFSQHAENGWGYSEETKPMLMTSYGFVPWDDAHHVSMSMTDGVPDGRFTFINANNTPRVARIDLKTFKTVEILEIPNSGGNHSSPYPTANTEYLVAGTRFSVPMGEEEADVPIETYKENFKGTVSFISMNKETGDLDLAFQVLLPGLNYDLAHSGKGPSHDWMFFSTYNSELAHSLLEVNASQNDKDFIMALNWKKAEELMKQGKGRKVKAEYAHNKLSERTHTATHTLKKEVLMFDGAAEEGLVYFIPCPKSPHGVDVDPTGKYIMGSGKLAAVVPVISFEKLIAAINKKDFEGEFGGIPIVKYESALHGELQKPGLGPLHTEFDGKGNAYTSMFLTSEIVKWNIEKLEVLDRVPTFYSIGHLMIPGGDSRKPWGKYVIAYNKITKDRFLPTGPELTQSAQLYDISGDKMKLLLDFTTVGEPHYAQAIPADLIAPNSTKVYKLEENEHPYVTKGESFAKVEKKGNEVHIWMTTIRSHLAPDNIEGVNVGDVVYFHVTNLEQDWDVPHGFAIKGANNSELLVMPGETTTMKWEPKRPGVYPFYCTDFCSALHQEMQGYLRVSPKGVNTQLKYGIDGEWKLEARR